MKNKSDYEPGDTIYWVREPGTTAIVHSSLSFGKCPCCELVQKGYWVAFLSPKHSLLLDRGVHFRCQDMLDSTKILRKQINPSRIWKELNEQ
jgi:hypothetical protein